MTDREAVRDALNRLRLVLDCLDGMGGCLPVRAGGREVVLAERDIEAGWLWLRRAYELMPDEAGLGEDGEA